MHPKFKCWAELAPLGFSLLFLLITSSIQWSAWAISWRPRLFHTFISFQKALIHLTKFVKRYFYVSKPSIILCLRIIPRKYNIRPFKVWAKVILVVREVHWTELTVFDNHITWCKVILKFKPKFKMMKSDCGSMKYRIDELHESLVSLLHGEVLVMKSTDMQNARMRKLNPSRLSDKP